MLKVGVASQDTASRATLSACLQQTGLVSTVVEWPVSRPSTSRPGKQESLPDVMLLDLSRDFESYFEFAAYLHRLRPSLCIIACSTVQQPGTQLLKQAMRNGVREFLSKPIESGTLRKIMEDCIREKGSAEIGLTRKLIVVVGAKGGVGTTTVAVNLGVQLFQITRKCVALLDFARPVGHVSLLLDLRASYSIRDATENLDRLDSHFLGGLLTTHNTRLKVLAGTNHPEDWQRIPESALARVISVAQSTFEFVVVDYGSVYLSEWNSILHLDPTVLFVAQTDVPALWALERHVSATIAHGLKSDRIHIVVNRWSRNDEEALKSVEKNIGLAIHTRLPNDFRKVSEATNLGIPLSKNHNNNLVSKFQYMAAQIAEIPLTSRSRRGILGNLFTF